MTAILVLDIGTTSVRGRRSSTSACRSCRWRGGRSRRRRRSPASSSSTPPSSRAVVLDAAGEAIARGTRVDRRRDHQPAGEHDRLGPRAPASRSARRSAGRTCARSASASSPRPSTASRLAPNQSATKIAWLLDHVEGARDRDLCFGTVDSWLAWTLSGGELHVTDHTNAAVTGLLAPTARSGAGALLELARRPGRAAAEIVDSSGVVGAATALPGAPPIAASSATSRRRSSARAASSPGGPRSRSAPAACSTSAAARTARRSAGAATTARSRSSPGPVAAQLTWGAEAIMLSAGTNVEWLRDDLGLIATSAESHDLAGVRRQHRRRGLRAGAARPGHAALGLRRPRHAARAHPGHDARPRRARRARGRRPPRRRPRRGRRGRHRAVDRGAAGRRRDERQPDVRPGARRRHRRAGRGLPRGRGDDARRRLPRRPGDRCLGRRRRRRPHVVARRASTSRGASLDREAWARAVERAAGWIPELSALDV